VSIKMVTIRVELDESLNERVNALCEHHGDKAFIIRGAIRREVLRREALKLEAKVEVEKEGEDVGI
jgi:predicted transcriptional regulator